MGLIFVLDTIKTNYLQGLKLVHTKCILFQSSVYGDLYQYLKRTLKMMDFSVKATHYPHSYSSMQNSYVAFFYFYEY